MTTNAQIQRHDTVISNIIDAAGISAMEVTKIIENRVAEIILATSTPNDSLPEITLAVNEPWRAWANGVSESLDAAAQDTIRLYSELGAPETPTPADIEQVNRLKDAAESSLAAPAGETISNIYAAIVYAAALGLSSADTAARARISVSGYLATVTDPSVTRLQEQYRRLIRTRNYEGARVALAAVRDAWGATPVGPNLLAMSRTASHDAVMDFDSVYGQWRGESLGVDRWRYAGGVSATTRDFCSSVSGREFTREQARELWSTRSWGGKRSGDPFVVRGGYNCRHYWVPVSDAIVGNLRQLQV